jgi:gliding motility-associated-like protein
MLINIISMNKQALILVLLCISFLNGYADRIYIMNSPGYNTAEPQLVSAITANGHTVTVNNTLSLPGGFASTCTDPVNGYDWLCFFGDNNFSGLLPQIQSFINTGGKVFYQYEVSCCTNSTSSAATIVSGLTGLPVTPNSNSYIALGATPAWEATNISCCVSFYGNAYMGLDGLPAANQFQATANLNGSTPAVSTCPNFGFHFATTDFTGTAHKGGIVGMGDLNAWYNGGEPFSNGGTGPVNMLLVSYFFPNDTNRCYLFPPGCLQVYNSNSSLIPLELGSDTVLCVGDTIILDATLANATYTWQDNSTNPTFIVTQGGTYSVEVFLNGCSAIDTIIVGQQVCSNPPPPPPPLPAPSYLEMPNVFTPNGDAENNYFCPVKMLGIEHATMVIYNRWGQKLFETEDLVKGWDGKYNGKDCAEGTYYWVILYNPSGGTQSSRKGSLTLLK